ncbi:MAG: mercuric ion transporter MerT [Myxococcales bacterium]
MEQVNSLPSNDMNSRKLSSLTIGGAVVSGLLASACCLGPLVFAALGIGGASLLVKFDPYRPLFTVATFGLLGAGFWFTYRKPKRAKGDACGCEYPKTNKLGRALLWVAAVVAVGLWAFPFIAERIVA